MPAHCPSRVGIVAQVHRSQHGFPEISGVIERPPRSFQALYDVAGADDLWCLLPPEAAIRDFQDLWMQRLKTLELYERIPSGGKYFVAVDALDQAS